MIWFIFRIAIFSVKVLRDERICVVAEQRPDCTEDESFQWMSRVLQAVDSIHQVGIYCLALVLPNHLPKVSDSAALEITGNFGKIGKEFNFVSVLLEFKVALLRRALFEG